MPARIPRRFFARSVHEVAPALIGATLLVDGVGGIIVELEAYHHTEPAAHSYGGETERNAVMYEPGGVWYVYLCYGMHELLNLVTGPRDYPAAVLIRGVVGASGPGRLTKALLINRRLNGTPATPEGGLWIEDRGVRVPRGAISATPRIGVDYAGPVWARKPWRFVLGETEADRLSGGYGLLD